MAKAKARPKAAPAVNIKRLIKAPRAAVFKAWTDPKELKKWWGPEGYTCPSAEIDLRVGGHYRFGFKGEEGDPFYVRGVYREVQRPGKLVFSWAWESAETEDEETLVTVLFRDAKGGTEIELSHVLFKDAKARDAHKQGWSSSLEKLAKLLG